MRTVFIIKDWAGNVIKFKNRPYLYLSFDDAEEVLSEELDDAYETDRGEYVIVESEES
jgi:hypothetical protein